MRFQYRNVARVVRLQQNDRCCEFELPAKACQWPTWAFFMAQVGLFRGFREWEDRDE